MAPKRRLTKKGETRMDAALDAMALYGFPNKLVRATVNSLLKVYGGTEGWVFIEDSGYTLLIETLLDKQSNPEPQDALEGADAGDGPNEVTPTGCSNNALLPCSNTQPSDDAPLTNQVIDASSASNATDNQLLINGVDTVSGTSDFVREPPFMYVDIPPVNIEPGNQLFIESANENPIHAATITAEKESECQPAGNLALAENHGQLVPRLGPKKRKPCHGWISSDDDEEELIELSPAPLSRIAYGEEKGVN